MRKKMITDAVMIREEARFALTFAGMLLALGFAVALGHAIAAALADPMARAVRGVMLGGPLLAMGWVACRYAAWRLEEAMAIEARRQDRRGRARAARRGAMLLRRIKQTPPLLAAKLAKCQQNLKLYLVGEQN
jgi:hypothetical protein